MLDVDRIEEALVAVAFGEHVADESGEQSALANLHDLRGRALEAGGALDVQMALAAYRTAIEICIDQGRRWTRLLPAVHSARALAEREDRAQAIDVIDGSTGTVPDDLHRPRVARARELLTELS